MAESAITAALPLYRAVRLVQPPIDCTHDIEPRHTEEFSHSLGLSVSPLDCDVRTSIGATAVSNISATPLSSPAYL